MDSSNPFMLTTIRHERANVLEADPAQMTSSVPPQTGSLLSGRRIRKSFGQFVANDDIDTIRPGELHALLGKTVPEIHFRENDLRLLCLIPASLMAGAASSYNQPATGPRDGIGMVFQHFSF